MIRTAALVVTLALAANPALAADSPADAPTATAQPSVADQIAAFLRDSPVAALPSGGAPATEDRAEAPRKPHGVIALAAGNHGYRSVYMRSDIPLGETGMLSIAIGESRGGFGGHGRRSRPILPIDGPQIEAPAP